MISPQRLFFWEGPMRKGSYLLPLCLIIGFAVGFTVAFQRENFVFALIRDWVAKAMPSDPTKTAAWVGRVSLFRDLDTQADVVMAGDSLTAHAEWAELFPGTKILNRGISGDVIEGLSNRVEEIMASAPQKIFLMIGVNDIRGGAKAADLVERYKGLVDKLHEPAKVIVQSTLFTANMSNNEEIGRLNKEMADFCTSSSRCQYIDLNAAIAPQGMLPAQISTDGLHLKGEAYLKWRDAISAYVR